jgi:NCS1 family nucleobase:cation symporter-1
MTIAERRTETGANGLSIERHSIDHIPASERHGRVSSLFPVWFAANMQVTTVVTGALGVILGLTLPWAILALALGNLFGAAFMALHSAQGPKLGIPQMIQSRAQFGYHGAIAPLLLVMPLYIGFFASGVVLGGHALAAGAHIPFVPAAIGLSVMITILTIYGYAVIHRLERAVSVLAAIVFVILTWRLFALNDVGAAWRFGALPFGPFLLVLSIAATWQITYAPYVADYSRYLPVETSIAAAFWWTYGGTVISSVWMMSLGSVAAAVAHGAFAGGSTAFIVGLAPAGMGWLASLTIVLGLIAIQVLNLYGMFMSSTTTLTAITDWKIGQGLRILFITVAAILGTALGIIGSGDFVRNLENFILFLAYFLIPWTAINLADYYWVRKERYDLAAIFDPAGIYGRVNWRTMIAYGVAIVAQVPFISSEFYTGPAVALFGGADVAWIVGLIVPAGLYVALMRGRVVIP